MEQISFTTADGYQLHGLWLVPVATYKGTILFSSATAIKKEYYLPFAQYLVQNGYRVLIYDYRGIGASKPAAGLKNFKATMYEWGSLDMSAAIHFLVEQKQVNELIWMGHSVGAQLMGIVPHQHIIKKVIAINASTGYWGYFPFPYNIGILSLWLSIGPLLTLLYGYAPMDKLGWGQPLPSGVYFQWRKWCLSPHHFKPLLEKLHNSSTFAHFTAPITSIYPSDDYISNDRTVKELLAFFPAAPNNLVRIKPADYGLKKIGHTGLFRRKHENNLWPLVVEAIEG